MVDTCHLMTLAALMMLAGITTLASNINFLYIFRYYNGDFPNYDSMHVDFLKNFILAQIDSYETGPSGVGWFMWTMKVEKQSLPANI